MSVPTTSHSISIKSLTSIYGVFVFSKTVSLLATMVALLLWLLIFGNDYQKMFCKSPVVSFAAVCLDDDHHELYLWYG